MPDKKKIVIATRNSPLALAQAKYVKNWMSSSSDLQDYEIELLPIVSTGDIKLETSLAKIGGKGLFTKELEEALNSGKADIAVHSLKDVPMEFDERYHYTYTARDSAEDVVVFRDGLEYTSLEELPPGSVVGTSSLRRQGYIRTVNPEVEVKLLRGNINTRLAKLNAEQKEYDAILMAGAALERLDDLEVDAYSVETLVPAPGQGIIAIQWMFDSELCQEYSSLFNNPISQICAMVEREWAAGIGGSCTTPIGINVNFLNEQDMLVPASELSKIWEDMTSEADKENPELVVLRAKELEEHPIKSLVVEFYLTDVEGKENLTSTLEIPLETLDLQNLEVDLNMMGEARLRMLVNQLIEETKANEQYQLIMEKLKHQVG